MTKYDTVYKNGEIGFTTNHLSDYAIIYDESVDSGLTEEKPEEKPVEKISIATAVIKQDKQVLYTGKQQEVPFTVTLNGKKLTEGVDYTVKTVNGNSVFTGVGKHKVTVTGIDNFTGKVSSYVYIVKGNQPLTVTPVSKSYKVATTKKKAQSFAIKTTNAKGKVTYKSSNTKYVTVSAKGKVTVKKGTPKGKYTITVTAAGNENYNKGSKMVTVTVK